MRLRKMFKNKLAFTLVELVIAIAVMAILAGAVAGAVVGVRASAQKSAVTSPASSLKTTLMTYYNGDYKNTDTIATLQTVITKDFTDAEVYAQASRKDPTTKKLSITLISSNTSTKLNTLKGSSALTITLSTGEYLINIKCDFDAGSFTVDANPTKI